MRYESNTYTNRQYPKEMEIFVPVKEYGMFPEIDDLALEALAEYMTERMDKLDLEDSFLILCE